jgi:hypothetical protein
MEIGLSTICVYPVWISFKGEVDSRAENMSRGYNVVGCLEFDIFA